MSRDHDTSSMFTDEVLHLARRVVETIDDASECAKWMDSLIVAIDTMIRARKCDTNLEDSAL